MATLRVAAYAEPLCCAKEDRLSPRVRKEKTALPMKGIAVFLADPKGFEPLTFWSVARRSIQLS